MRRGYLKLLFTGFSLALLAMGLAPAGASSANISRSYQTVNPITNGSLVSLDPLKQNYVQPANTSNASRLIGVAVASKDSLIAVDASSGTAQVATSGNASVLVSTLNGDINVGDQIAVSPFSGVGMKASPGSRAIGLAQTAFNAGSKNASSRQITDKNGKATSIDFGYVSATIAVGSITDAASLDNLSSLQKLAKSLTGHVVSTQRIIVSLIVALIALFTLVTLTYASIYGSIISVGRNPLAKYAVFRTLGSVLALAVMTAVIAVIIIFFLLR